MIGEQSPQSASALEPGRVFGERYEIVSPLGSGGMGTVYRAVDRLSGDTVALKIVTSATPETLRSELLLARALSHPNIVRIFDIGVLEDTAFISMEYVNGPTLG